MVSQQMSEGKIGLSSRDEHLVEIEEAVGRAVGQGWISVIAFMAVFVPLYLSLSRNTASWTPHAFIASKIRYANPFVDADSLARVIVSESLKAGVDPFVVASVIKHESRFRKSAVSPKGALGLMQIMPETARYISRKAGIAWEGYDGLKQPQYNIRLGIAYLKYLHGLFDGDFKLVLMAYNWGPGNVKRIQRTQQKPVECVERYSHSVLETRTEWFAEYRLYAL